MVMIFPLPQPFARKRFQVPFGRWRTLRLEFSAQSEDAALLLFPSLLSQEQAGRGYDGTGEAQSHANDVLGWGNHRLRKRDHHMQEETPTACAHVSRAHGKVVQAAQVCAVSDGALWLQNFFDLHRPDAVRILDFPHAAEHLSLLLQAIEQAAVPVGVLARCVHILKHRGPGWLLRIAARLPETLLQQDGIREHLGYFHKRAAMMQYPQFQKLGWPIGSGMVESANKPVVQARLKGAGQHWLPRNVNLMLALRNAVCNARWQEQWQVVVQRTHQQQIERRKSRARLRKQAASASAAPSPLSCLPPPQPETLPPVPAVVARLPASPAATLPGSSCPSAHHPWKRGPSCSPRQFAKI